MKKIVLIIIALNTIFWSCNEKDQLNDNHNHDHEHFHAEYLGFEENENRTKELSERYGNPYGLAVAINSPFDIASETHHNWSAPNHPSYWGGQWSVDIWGDNNSADPGWINHETYTCNKAIFIDATPVQYPTAQKAQSLKAELLLSGYACASQNFYDGGFAQIWKITATYNGVEYAIGEVTYAHLSYLQYTEVGTVVNIDSKLYIGHAFWGNNATGCWGSCHIHFEMKNYQNGACYNFSPDGSNIQRLGILGGYNGTTGRCTELSNDNGNNNGDVLYNVKFQSTDNLYLCSENGWAYAIANRAAIGAWEIFTLEKASDGTYAIKGNNGYYADVDRGNESRIKFNNSNPNCSDCRFNIIDVGGGYVAIKSVATGRYVASEGTYNIPVRADRASVAHWEKWRMIQ